MAKTEIIGLIRFSFLWLVGQGTNGYLVKHDSTEARRAFLYDRARMESRIKIFELITLPSLLKQTHQDFKVIILIGDDFPDWALDRLEELTEGTQLIIEKKPVMDSLNAIGECFEKHFSADCETRITFRLDDDDAISLDYFHQLYHFSQKLDWNEVEGDNFVVYLRYGIVLHNHNDFALEHGYMYPVKRFQPWSVGTAIISKNGSKTNAYSKGHVGLCAHFPSQHMPMEHALLRVFHGGNDLFEKFITYDLEQKKFQKGYDWMRNKINDFEGTFGIDLEELIAFLGIDEELFIEKLTASQPSE